MGDFLKDLEVIEEIYVATGTISDEDAKWLLGWVRTLADALQREKDKWKVFQQEDGVWYVDNDIPIPEGEEG